MCKLRKLMGFERSWTQCRRPEFIWLRKSERERWKMCVKFINDELEVAVRLSAEEESGCRQFARRLDEDLASQLSTATQHSIHFIFTLNVFFFSASSLDTSRCWWMWIQTSFTAQFHVFLLFFEAQSRDLYHREEGTFGARERWEWNRKKLFHHLMNFKSHLKLSVNLSNNLNNSSHLFSSHRRMGWETWN